MLYVTDLYVKNIRFNKAKERVDSLSEDLIEELQEFLLEDGIGPFCTDKEMDDYVDAEWDYIMSQITRNEDEWKHFQKTLFG